MKQIKPSNTAKPPSRTQGRQTVERVDKAIQKLKRSKSKKINFHSVAEESGVARTTLYRNHVLRERVLINRELQEGKLDKEDISPSKLRLEQKNKKIRELHGQIAALKEQKQDLIVQLIEMEELKKENERLRKRVARPEKRGQR